MHRCQISVHNWLIVLFLIFSFFFVPINFEPILVSSLYSIFLLVVLFGLIAQNRWAYIGAIVYSSCYVDRSLDLFKQESGWVWPYLGTTILSGICIGYLVYRLQIKKGVLTGENV